MTIESLEKLSKNPHYKLSPKQRAELERAKRKPMVEFGILDKHDNTKPIHSVGPIKRGRKSK